MSMAWETTEEDIANVVENEFGVDPDIVKLDHVSSLLNHDAIEKAALYGDEMDEQVNLAYKEMKNQLVRNHGWIPITGVKK